MLILDAVKVRAARKAETSCCGGCAKGKPCCGKKRRRKCGEKKDCWSNLFVARPSGLLIPDERLIPARSMLGMLPWEQESWRQTWNRPLLMPVFDMSCLPCCAPHEQNCCPELDGDFPLTGTTVISNACCARLNQTTAMSLFNNNPTYVSDAGVDVCDPIIIPQALIIDCNGSGQWGVTGPCGGIRHDLTLHSCSPLHVSGTVPANGITCCNFAGGAGGTMDIDFQA
jgi:hypothetical protein